MQVDEKDIFIERHVPHMLLYRKCPDNQMEFEGDLVTEPDQVAKDNSIPKPPSMTCKMQGRPQ